MDWKLSFEHNLLKLLRGPMVLYKLLLVVLFIFPDSFVDGSPQVEFGSLYNSIIEFNQ